MSEKTKNADLHQSMIVSYHTFLKLLHPVLQNTDQNIDDKLLHQVTEAAKKNNLLILLYVQLRRYNEKRLANPIVSKFLENLKPVFLTNASRCIKQEAEENKIISLLAKNKIDSLVIKGNEIAKEIYQNPNCRTSVDIDILIKESDLLKTEKILTKFGYKRTDNKSLKFWTSRIHHAVYVGAETKSILEIHWNFGIPTFFNLTSEEIWKEIQLTENGLFKLSPDMLLILLIIHHTLHAYRDLKILVDILWTMYRYEDLIDWRSFSQKLSTIEMTKASLITLNQIESLWNDFASEFQPVKTLYLEFNKRGCKQPKFLTRYFKLNFENENIYSHGKDQFFVRFTLDKSLTILFSFIKTFFPFPESIKELYNDQRIRTLPLNYLKFIKWRLTSGPGN